jgi:ChaB
MASPMALNKKQRPRLPSTLARSPKKAQNTYIETLEAAEKKHGDGEAAHRIALASLEHSFEKVGDHWERKQEEGSERCSLRDGRAACRPQRSSAPNSTEQRERTKKTNRRDQARPSGLRPLPVLFGERCGACRAVVCSDSRAVARGGHCQIRGHHRPCRAVPMLDQRLDGGER